MTEQQLAYEVGFCDGYKYGREKNPYSFLQEYAKNKDYRRGYDKGVSEYCKEEL